MSDSHPVAMSATYDSHRRTPSRRFGPGLPRDLVRKLEMWVATEDDEIVGLVASSSTMVEPPYVDPDHTGQSSVPACLSTRGRVGPTVSSSGPSGSMIVLAASKYGTASKP